MLVLDSCHQVPSVQKKVKYDGAITPDGFNYQKIEAILYKLNIWLISIKYLTDWCEAIKILTSCHLQQHALIRMLTTFHVTTRDCQQSFLVISTVFLFTNLCSCHNMFWYSQNVAKPASLNNYHKHTAGGYWWSVDPHICRRVAIGGQ